jgi:hypothetical protein
VGCLILNLSIAIYSIVKGKDPQGQMGYMYEMFQKHTVDQKFVSAFERFQKDVSVSVLLKNFSVSNFRMK